MGQVVEGRYTGRALEGRLCESKNGAPQVAIALEVKMGDNPEDFGIINWYGSLKGGATQYTMEALRSLGWDTDDVSNLHGIDQREVDVVVTSEEWEGKTRLKVSIFRAGSALGKPMEAQKAAQIVKDLRAAAIRSRQAEVPAATGGGYSTQRTPTRAVPAYDIEIPF